MNINPEQSDLDTGTDNVQDNGYNGTLKSLLKYTSVKIAAIFALITLPIPVISLFWSGFAEAYSRGVGGFFRMVLAKITGILPFSLAEIIVVFGTGYVVAGICYGIVQIFRKNEYISDFEINFNRRVACAVLAALALYNLGFASCNRRYPLEKNLGLERSSLTAEQLYDCMVIVNRELEKCFDEGDIRYTPGGASCMPYDYTELNKKLNGAFAEFSQSHRYINGFSSVAKRLALSKYLTYTHISGIYIPYTGEVNINTNYPDYVVTFTHAHEMAHQRGIAREDEANFVAFMLLYENGDNYMRYSALTELFSYLSDALYSASPELFSQVLLDTDPRTIDEMIAFEEFFTPYADSVASDVMGAVNDTSIKLRGDADGAKSYNMMVELAAAYFGVTD